MRSIVDPDGSEYVQLQPGTYILLAQDGYFRRDRRLIDPERLVCVDERTDPICERNLENIVLPPPYEREGFTVRNPQTGESGVLVVLLREEHGLEIEFPDRAVYSEESWRRGNCRFRSQGSDHWCNPNDID
ncbi:hypothetical protein DRN75_03340 [Nanoarchaeota archaeon]|nr:MAG: hypothetical protein DRN75_03340 [Nanoarchaeota archaeon]